MNEITMEKCKSVLMNYPEYSSPWIKCVEWGDYSVLTFMVMSKEDESIVKQIDLTAEQLAVTFDKVGENSQTGNSLGKRLELYYEDEAEFFDMEATDNLMQYHFYGRPIYG